MRNFPFALSEFPKWARERILNGPRIVLGGLEWVQLTGTLYARIMGGTCSIEMLCTMAGWTPDPNMLT